MPERVVVGLLWLRMLAGLLALSTALVAMAVSAVACEGGGGQELTTLSTKLSGEGKEGEELTVLAGAKVKDKATLSGKNAAKATGKVTYKVYSDKECKTLVTSAGEVTVSGENVPASSEEELEGGKTYYWQAHYSGDTNNFESTSTCTEALQVRPVACAFPYCQTTITPGVGLRIFVSDTRYKECTAGPIMTRGAELFLLTAGHCINTGTGMVTQVVNSRYPNIEPELEREIGKTGTYTNNVNYDTAEVKIEKPEWQLAGGGTPPLLVEWLGRTFNVTPIVGKALNLEGEESCLSGASSELRCGEIVRVGVTAEGHKNLIETSVQSAGGDSGAPVFTRTLGGVLIQGTHQGGNGSLALETPGTFMRTSKKITGVPEGEAACKEIEEMKKMWPFTGVPVTRVVTIPAGTTVIKCEVVGTNATIEMSNPATETRENVLFTIGHVYLAVYEPMYEIEAAYPGQTLLMR